MIIIDDECQNTPFTMTLGKDLVTKVEGEREPLWFDHQIKHNPKRIILHHTAGEGSRGQLYRVLRGRGLSVHFGIDAQGNVTQYADTHRKCAHAGKLNRDSIGIEISNRAVYPNVQGHQRSEVMEEIHGKHRLMLRFYLGQVIAAHALCKLLCERLGIPKAIPRDGDKAVRHFLGVQNCQNFVGILGHYHCSEKKIDPVPHLLDDLIQFFDKETFGK